jgi:hypothetical protein
MMTEHRDPALAALFEQANRELEGEALTAQVMSRTRNRLAVMAGGAALLTVAALLVAWQVFAMPMLEFAVMVSQFLTNPLIDLGEGWLGLVFLPINNLASLFVLTARGVMLGWKKLTGTSLIR